MTEHDTENTKRASHPGTAGESVSTDLWHKKNGLGHGAVGKPVSAEGGDAVEFAERERDESRQIGNTDAYERFSAQMTKKDVEKAARRGTLSALKSAGFTVAPSTTKKKAMRTKMRNPKRLPQRACRP